MSIYKLSDYGFESLLTVTYVSHTRKIRATIFLYYSGNFTVTIQSTQKQKQDKNTKRKVFKTSKEKFFKTSFLLLILASKESLSSIVLFQRSTLFFLIFINLFIYIYFIFPAINFSKLRIINQTCSNCNGSVFMERICVNRKNCTGQNNTTIAYNEKETIKRQCSIAENQQKGGCIPGNFNIG